MIYIGFDYGDKRTGVSISDASAFLAGRLLYRVHYGGAMFIK